MTEQRLDGDDVLVVIWRPDAEASTYVFDRAFATELADRLRVAEPETTVEIVEYPAP